MASDDFMAAQRVAASRRDGDLRIKANPDCLVCRGRGQTGGYVAPSKSARYACYCTGEADWQR